MDRFDYAIFMTKNGCDVNIKERNTNKHGVISVSEQNPNMIWVFYGNDDGSDDKIIDRNTFNEKFIIESISFTDNDYDDWISIDRDFSDFVNKRE